MNESQVAEAITYHRLRHIKSFTLPHDCPKADAERFSKEIREQYPINGLIITNYVSPDKVNGGMLHPEGRKLGPDETWKETHIG